MTMTGCSQSAVRAEPEHQALQVPSVRVLVVDDDPWMRSMLADALSDHGFDVVMACDGIDAVTLLRAERSGIDVVVMDHRMPRSTGLEAMEAVRAFDDWTPVILLTAFADAQFTEEARRLGVAEVLAKPCSVSELVATVCNVAPAGL